MGLYVADKDANGGYLHAGADELARKIAQGDGILWTGDPRLELGMATAVAPKSMWYAPLGRRVKKGEVLARRYEVWRNNEDGTRSQVGHWLLEEFDRILMDLAPLRMDAPGHEDAIDQIDKHNEALEKERDTVAVEAMMEQTEHALKLHHDTTGPKNVFRGMPGMRDLVTEAPVTESIAPAELVVISKSTDPA